MALSLQPIGSDRGHSPASEASSAPPRTPISPVLDSMQRGPSGLSHIGAEQPAPAAPPKRKSSRRANTAERRATHNAVERQRRETLNGRFLDLANLLPNLTQIRRPSKSSIVNSSIAHIHASRRHRLTASREVRALKTETDALRREINEWRDRAGLPRIEEPVRSEGFTMVLSGELELLAAAPDEDGEVGEYVEQDGEAMDFSAGEEFIEPPPALVSSVPSSSFPMEDDEQLFAHNLPPLSSSTSSRSSSGHGHPRPSTSTSTLSMSMSRDGPPSCDMMIAVREQQLAREAVLVREQARREVLRTEREYRDQAQFGGGSFGDRELHNHVHGGHRDPVVAHPSGGVAYGDPANMASMYDSSMFNGHTGSNFHAGHHDTDKLASWNSQLYTLSAAQQLAAIQQQQMMFNSPGSGHGLPSSPLSAYSNDPAYTSFLHRQRREQEILARARSQLLSPHEQQVLREHHERGQQREEENFHHQNNRRRDRSSSLSNSHDSLSSFSSPGAGGGYDQPRLSINTGWREDDIVKTEMLGKDALKSPMRM